MGYKSTARAMNKAKELVEKNKLLEKRIENLVSMLNDQKLIYMNVVKAIVLQVGVEDGDAYKLNIPLDVSGFSEWQMEANPEEETNSLILRVKKGENHEG